jgi:membrane-bound lytic murein transglycosylase B
MQSIKNIKKYWFVLALFILPISRPDSASSIRPDLLSRDLSLYSQLIDNLVAERLPRTAIYDQLLDPRVQVYKNIYRNNFIPPVPEKTQKADKNTRTPSYNISEFNEKYGFYLELAESLYGIDREVLIALLFVETKLGKNIGKYSVFNVLISQALLDTEPTQKNIQEYVSEKYSKLPAPQRQREFQRLLRKATLKAQRARQELAALIRLHLETSIDIHTLKGSYAGAFGYPQFLPSSLLRYGIDGDLDGLVNLYSFPDAILSAANFLKYSGWDLDPENQKRALFQYNCSRQYVARVLNKASTIKNLMN